MSNNYHKDLFPFHTEKLWDNDKGDHNGWNVLSEFFETTEGDNLIENLLRAEKEEKIFPAQEDIFKAFKLTPFNHVKVVILGQDPYPDGRADGLCFSQKNDPNVNNKNDSLRRIFKTLDRDDGSDDPKTNLIKNKYNKKQRQLDAWAKQGVLLLNTILTVRSGNPGSHKKLGWKKLTELVIESILKNNKDVAFILLGRDAEGLFNATVSKKFNKYELEELETYFYKYRDYKIKTNHSEFYIIESPHPNCRNGRFEELPSPFVRHNILNKSNPIDWKQLLLRQE